MLVEALIGLFLLAASPAASAQPLTFSTLAGSAGEASADGAGGAARFYQPQGIAVDNAGTLFVADTANHTIRKISAAGLVSTLAGQPGISGYADGSGSSARFNQPQGIAVDSGGAVYVADAGNHVIRKITAAGVVSTVAGTAGSPGSADGTGSGARFNNPEGVAVDSAGNYLYVADTWNHTIRKVSSSGVVTTLAGTAGLSGSANGTGSAARFYQPGGVAVDSSGTVYVADTGNHTVRQITAAGVVTTLAGTAGSRGSADGTGATARFYQPQGVTVDGSGTLYVADYLNQTIRKVTSAGVVTTLAGLAGNPGNVDGSGSDARFYGPAGVAVGGNTVYVADMGNSLIRKVTTTGIVSTLAGTASAGSTDGTGNIARFNWPGGIAVDSAGALYIADAANHTLRKATAGGTVSTLAGSAGRFGSADGGGSSARFYGLQGVAVSGTTVYVADAGNHTVRRVTAAGVVSTLAGAAGTNGSADGIGSAAQFNWPEAVAADRAGAVYVADTRNHTIRKISAAGAVTTWAGVAGKPGCIDSSTGNTGTNGGRFNFPAGLAVDGAGNVYVSDTFNHTIRKVSAAGVVSTLAGMPGLWGQADGTGNAARFFQPRGLTLDNAGNLYVADQGNHAIRKLTPVGASWVVTTVAGLPGLSGSTDGVGMDARFNYPAGIATDGTGRFWVADAGNNTIRLGSLVPNGWPAITAQPKSRTANPGEDATFSVTAIGTAPLSFQWRSNGLNLVGATNSRYTRAGVQSADAGSYSVVVTNTVGSVTSADAALGVNGPPYVMIQPQDQYVAGGEGARFAVVAGGTRPLSYQWRFEGGDISDATASAFTVASAQRTNIGLYSVLVTNSLGAVLSANAQLGVVTTVASGDNTWGQVAVPLATANAIAIAAGAWHGIVLRADGTVVCWGNDYWAQSQPPSGLQDALAVAAGGYHSLALRTDGTVTAWGANDYNQTNVPPHLAAVIAISAGTWHSLALDRDGRVTPWGDNSVGQCTVPVGLSNVVAIAAGGNHNLALRADGTVAAWGENTDANGSFVGQAVAPLGLTNGMALGAGDYHSLVVRADGTVLAWGDNSQGQCNVPAGLSNVVAVAGGGAHSLALKADGTVVAWGADWASQCDLPPGLSDVVGIAAGEVHSVFLMAGILPVPRLWSPVWRGGNFDALVQSLHRRSYALEFRDTLDASTWTALSTNAGNGSLLRLGDPAATDSQRFYRFQQW